MKDRAGNRAFGAAGEVLVYLGLLFACGAARASVAVLLEQPYGDLGRVYPAGHSAIYLDHVCAASPTELRPCGAGELGVVLSRYDGVGGYDWLAVPLIPYLYSVETADEIPLSMDKIGETRVRDAYRRAHLESVAPDLANGNAPAGNWYELVGSAYDRTIYGFSVKTTAEQDAGLIAMFNDRRNVQRYNGEFTNCADFTRVTINRFYPHAVRRNFIADFGMTSPKSVARGLAHYAKKHPETEFHTFVVPQVAGSLPRSRGAVDLAEGILKQYSIPLVILSPTTVGVVAVAYLIHGRFAMPKDAPLLDLHQAVVEAGVVPKLPAEDSAGAGGASVMVAATMVIAPAVIVAPAVALPVPVAMPVATPVPPPPAPVLSLVSGKGSSN